MSRIDEFEKALGATFQNKELLQEALTHRSYLNENPRWNTPHNERLEFLGDAVLELVVTEYLFSTYGSYQEGQLTSLRAALVNYIMLARIAHELGLEKYLYLSRGESRDSRKARDVILANAIEAVFGALYLDQGYEITRGVIKNCVLSHLNEVLEQGLYRDPKSALQELVQERFKVTPTYRVLREEGPDHEKSFSVGVFYSNTKIADAVGSSKQEAESRAAEAALILLEKSGQESDSD